MEKVRLIKACQFLYRCSEVGIMVCGICMVFILALISYGKLQGLIVSGEVNFNEATSGWYPYLWVCLMGIYLVGSVVIIGKWLKEKANPTTNKFPSIGSVRSGKEEEK